MLTTEKSHAARAPRQESRLLNEPCHCGQTPRLPENKQRRGLEAAAEAGRHDLPSRASTRLASQQVFISIQAAQAALGMQEVAPTAARLDARGLLPPSTFLSTSSVPQCCQAPWGWRKRGEMPAPEEMAGPESVPSGEHEGKRHNPWRILEEAAGAESLGWCPWWPLIRGFARSFYGNGLSCRYPPASLIHESQG